MRHNLRPGQRETFGQADPQRCVRRPYIPVDEFDHNEHPVDVLAVNLRYHDLLHGEQQSHTCPCTQNQNPSLPSHIWRGLLQCVIPPPARIIANLPRPTPTACLIADTACHFSREHSFLSAYCPVV